MCSTIKPEKVKRRVLLASIEAFLKHYDQNTCTHEETHRGGTIWTICDQCGREWADDRNPFKPYVEPKFVTDARDILYASEKVGD